MNEDKHIELSIDHLFRHESGKMVAVLSKIFGIENIDLAEDVVQESLISALENWKFNGLPDNPKAWLYRVAKNKAIDVLRKSKHDQSIDFSDPDRRLFASEYTLLTSMDDFWDEERIKDEFLGMMFAICRPEITHENRLSFILKSLCGFSTKEVAKAFLTSEDTVSKRIYRTKEFFRKHKIRPQIPSDSELPPRLKTVLSCIYLIFNEGYNSTHHTELIREDLVSQAMYLTDCLVNHPVTDQPEVHALMALICLHASRLQSRVNSNGDIILLKDQDRSLWNGELMRLGFSYLNSGAKGNHLTEYHLEALISWEHARAESYESTSWKTIIAYYDQMLLEKFDSVIFLNRCLAIMEDQNPEKALAELSTIEHDDKMLTYYLFHSAKAEMLTRLGIKKEAKKCLRKAISLTLSESEQRLLTAKLASI